MRSFKRKLLAGVMALAMLMSVVSVPTMEAKADTASNVTFSSARSLVFGTTIAEEMSGADSWRYYKFSLNQASVINIGITNNYKGGYFYIYDDTKTEVYNYVTDSWSTNCNTGNIYLTGGNYYLGINGATTISFKATMDTVGESFVETQDKNNDMYGSASKIALTKKYKGALTSNDDIDYYLFKLPAKGTITFNLNNGTGNSVKYQIYDSSVNLSYSKAISSGNKTSDAIELAGGSYYLAIQKYNADAYSSNGSYTFSIDYAVKVPGAPSVSSVKNSKGKKLTVKWNKRSGVTGYELQYSTKSNFASGIIKKTIASSKTSVTCTGLKKGKTYYVRMRSYITVNGAKKYSKWGTKKTVKITK